MKNTEGGGRYLGQLIKDSQIVGGGVNHLGTDGSSWGGYVQCGTLFQKPTCPSYDGSERASDVSVLSRHPHCE